MTSFGQARPLRWLIAAPFSAHPTGRQVIASGERFPALMTRVGPKATVQIPDGLGNETTRTVALQFDRPRDFRVAEVIKRVELLSSTIAIADEFGRKNDYEGMLAGIKAALGEGNLLQALQQLTAESPEPAPAPEAPAAAAANDGPPPAPAASESSGSTLDAIFAKAEIAAPAPAEDASQAAKSGLDAFIGAMRRGGDSSASPSSKASAKALAQRAAALIRRAVEATALDMLAAPLSARLESSWRGLKMVMAASPGTDDLGIEIVDTDANGVVEAVERALSEPPMDRPDAVFVALPIASIEVLGRLAALGSAASVPVVVDVPEAATGAVLHDDGDTPEPPETWTALRGQPTTTWLCATSNAVVLVNEEVLGTRRFSFGSPVWGVAALVSASVGQTGGPGQIFGRAGALVSPASYDMGDGKTIATERVATVDHQRSLATRGVLVLGSERGSDRLRLAGAPMVHHEGDELQLPGRILAGRAARLARAIRDELPPQATEQEISARMAEASANFLPRSPRGTVALEVRTDDDGKIGVDASIGAALAGASFKFSSDL